MDKPVRLFLVDDHPFFRQGVRFYLSSLKEFELVGEADSGEHALQVLKNAAIDVVLMDLQMTGTDGIETTEALLQLLPDVRVLILTSFGSEDKISRALQAGAAGYCLKDAPPEELTAAIRAVAAGGTYLGRGILPRILTSTNLPHTENGETIKPGLHELTQREQDVFKLLAEGLGNKEIAEKLFVSEKTVKTHVANILQKLDVKTRTQAAILAKEHNFFQGA